jgi:hypothetical protein
MPVPGGTPGRRGSCCRRRHRHGAARGTPLVRLPEKGEITIRRSGAESRVASLPDRLGRRMRVEAGGMSNADGPWWLDDRRTWHRDGPRDAASRALQQTGELRALVEPWPDPPPVGPATEKMTALPARHLGRGGERRERAPGGRRSLSRLLAGTGILSLATAALAIAAVVAVSSGRAPTRDDQVAVPGAGPTITSPGDEAPGGGPTAEGGRPDPSADAGPVDAQAAAPAPMTSTTSTTTSPPPTTVPAPMPTSPPVAVDPLAACSAGQRNLIERGNHPWEWYAARFDPDGDGVLCT